MAITARAEPGSSQEPEAPSRPPARAQVFEPPHTDFQEHQPGAGPEAA